MQTLQSTVTSMILMLLTTHSVYAQAVVIPRSVEAGEAERRAKQVPQPQKPIMIAKPTPIPLLAPEGADKAHFHLDRIVIEGNTVYSDIELTRYYSELLGNNVSLQDIYAVATDIQQHYLDDGYILASVYLPPQEIDSTVRIRIAEGYVARIDWTGENLDSKLVEKLTDRILSMRPFSGDVLESIMIQLNGLPSVRAKSAIAPYTVAGAADLQIKIEREHVSGSFGVDSYASRHLGVWQENANMNINSLFDELDRLSLSGSVSTNPKYSHYFRGEYSLPVHESGTTLRGGGSFSRSAPGFALEPLDVRSRAKSYWLGVSQPVLRSREESLSLDGQFTINNQTTDVLGAPLYEDRVRTLTLSTLYSKSDTWEGSNLISIALVQGLDILDNTKTGTATLSRLRGHSDFTKLTLNLSRLQVLDEDFSLLLASEGQISNAPLLSSEQFGFGGQSFGRGYDSSELTGDEGIAASIELRYSSLTLDDEVTLQPFMFYDIGKVWNQIPQGDVLSAASAGAGARFGIGQAGTLELTLSKPLTYTPATPKLGAEGKNVRYGMSFRLSY